MIGERIADCRGMDNFCFITREYAENLVLFQGEIEGKAYEFPLESMGKIGLAKFHNI